MRRIFMTQILLLIFVLFKISTHATEINKIDEDPSYNVIANTLKIIYTQSKKNLKIPEECMVCYERFPVSLQFSCGHELCALCTESMMNVCDNKNCPKCRAQLPHLFTEWLPMINIYPIQITSNISLDKLQHAFPLICSIASLRTVIKCINFGVDVNTKGYFGYFPIQLASQKNVVKYLVDKGADVNKPSNGVTPLLMSSPMGYLLVIKYLIKKGAKFKNQVKNGATIQFLTRSQNGHLPIVQFLVENAAENVNQRYKKGELSKWRFASCSIFDREWSKCKSR